MKRLAFGIVACVALATATASQPPGRGPHGGPAYDPQTVETVSGEVVRVERVPSPRGRGEGLHAVVKPDAGPDVTVHLGPASFLEAQGLHLAAKDRVQVTGSRVPRGTGTVILAAQVRTGDRTVVLRDAAGVPAWSGGPRGPGKGRP